MKYSIGILNPDGLLNAVGALYSQGRDILRYNKISSKFTAVVQPGHSVYPGWNTIRCFRNTIECPTTPVGHCVVGHSNVFRKHRFVCTAGVPGLRIDRAF